MTGVWASYIGGNFKPANNYTHCYNFWKFNSLIEKMGEEGLYGKVGEIGILAHGDKPGLVQFEGGMRVLTVESLQLFKEDIEKLRFFLTPNGKLIFWSCIAGAGDPGEKLLAAISKLLHGRTIIGFTVVAGAGVVDGFAGAPSPAGHLKDLANIPSRDLEFQKYAPRLTIHSSTAVWAQDDLIIKPDSLTVTSAQRKDPKNRCGSIWCQGHKEQGYKHRCPHYGKVPGRTVYLKPLPPPPNFTRPFRSPRNKQLVGKQRGPL
jgi:hypothetical protein